MAAIRQEIKDEVVVCIDKNENAIADHDQRLSENDAAID
jgi:hypothetical protein